MTKTTASKTRRVAVAALVAILVGGLWYWLDRRNTSPPLPDLAAYKDIDERKAAFFDYLAPIIEAQNARIADDRRKLLHLAERQRETGGLCCWNRAWLKQLAADYGVDWQGADRLAVIEALKPRVDVIPVSLALVQAAKESAWGRSRFARQGNNLFGQWCYEEGCGIVPGRRAAGASHEVQVFDSTADAVASYLNNLNSHRQYRDLRRIRARLREAGKEVTGLALAQGLVFYSERRGAYVREVRNMIHQYRRFRAQEL